MEEKPVLNNPLSERRRELMLRVMDGKNDLAGTMHCLHAYKFCDNFLIWLIEQKWTGKNLEDLLVKKFHSSVPALVEYMVGAMSKADARKIT